MSKNLWVVALQENGKLLDVSLEIITRAAQLAKEMNEEVVALVIGKDNEAASKEALQYGADRVVSVEGEEYESYRTLPYTHVLETVIEEHEPLAILIPATFNGRDLGGRISARKALGLVADCIDVKSVEGEKLIDWVRPTFDGKLISTIRITTNPQIGTVGSGVFKKKIVESPKTEIIKEDIGFKDDSYVIVEEKQKEAAKAEDLEGASRIVSFGMGIGGPENFKIAEDLAKELKAELGVTKPIADKGWEPYEKQVGVSGKKVAPKLYIALGISGAKQHTLGMKDSELIIAINKDPDAPIFQTSHYQVVGDIFEIVPKLTEKLKEM